MLVRVKCLCCRFYKAPSGTKIQELAIGSGPVATNGDKVSLDYVLRRSNGYFIYSTVEGVSFQPRDIPVGPFDFRLVSAVSPDILAVNGACMS